MRWDTSKVHNMHRARAEQKDCTYRAQAGVRGITLDLDATAITREHHGFQQPVNMHKHTTHRQPRIPDWMQRGFQRTAQQQRQSGLQRTTQQLSSTEGRVTRAPAQRAPLSGTLTTLPCSVSGVQRGMRSCVLTTAAVRSGTQLGPVARRRSALRHWRLSCFSST